MRTAPALLAAVALVGCAGASAHGASRELRGYGISLTLPVGWHGRVSTGNLAAATFRLPPGDTGFGTATARRLRHGGLLLLLSEYGGLPGERLPCLPRRFAPPIDAHTLRGSSFCLSGRHFVLFVRPRHVRPAQVEAANGLLLSLRVRPGNFYPGSVQPARFPAGGGWHVGSSGPQPIRPFGAQTASWAATVPYSDPAFQLPAHRTLARLRADGIAIWLGLSVDTRHLSWESRPWSSLRIDPRAASNGFEGLPANRGLYRAYVPRSRYALDVWVFFGRPRPTGAQVARAQAELDSVRLPAWPRL